MTYVANDGSVLQNAPFFKRIAMFFVRFWQFLVMFFKTLFGKNVNKWGSKYTREYRGGNGGGPGGGSGGPRPPERKIGRMSDVSAPSGGCCGGGGCG